MAHFRMDMKTKTESEIIAPVGVIKDESIPDDTDTGTTPPIKTDTVEEYEARVSPRAVSWLVNAVKQLQSRG